MGPSGTLSTVTIGDRIRRHTRRAVRHIATTAGLASAALFLVASPALAIADPGSTQPPGTGGFNTVMSWAKWLAFAACLIGLFIVAGTMAVAHRQGAGASSAVSHLGGVIGGTVIAAAAAGLITALGG